MLFSLGLGTLALNHVRDGAGDVCAHAAHEFYTVARCRQLLEVDHSVANDILLDYAGLVGHQLFCVAAGANENGLILSLLLYATVPRGN